MRSAQGNTNVTPLATTTTTTAGHTPFPIDATLHSNDSINSVAFSPDGTLLAMGSSDNTTKLWRVADGVCTATLVSHSNSSITCVYCVAFSPDGTLLATTNYDNTTKLWRVADGVCRVTLKGHKRAVLCVAFSPDGMLLATGSAENTLKFWRVADGKCTATLGAHSNTVRSVAFSPDGTLLATGGWDSCTKLWRVADHVLMEILDCPSSYVMSVAFSPDGKLLAAGGGQATRLWRVDYDSCTATLTATLEGYSVTTVAFSPDGKVLATGSSFKTTKLWRVAGGACTATLEGHSESVSSVAFSPDGALLATGSNDKTTNLWRLKGARNNIVPKRSAPVFPHVKLGDLSIGDTIGGGSSGVVLKCKWKGQTCALKQYHPNIVRKIEREVVVAPHLQHPNIVSVVAIVDSSDGGAQTVGLLMEIAAKSLGDLLELSERPPQATILQWLHEAAQGIEFAHQCRVVHSDIKPDNIMTVLDQKLGTVAKVSDFGSATSRDTFDHVLEALPRVPRHLPIAVCGNFWDLVHEDKERLEVDEKDVEKLLKLVAHRAVTPLFASFLAAANRSNQSTGGGAHHSLPPPPALSSFVVDPVHIQLSVKDGFGLTPLHRFTGVCAAFAKAVELDASIQHAYGRVASAAEDLNALNEDQKYEEFLQWKADAEERKQKQYLMFEENQRRRQQQQHDTTGRDEELQISSSPLPDSDEDNRSTTRSKKSQPQSLRSAGRAKRGSAAAAAAVRQAEREGGVAQSKDNRATNKPQLQSQSQPATSASASASAVTLASMTFGDAIAPSFFDGADFDEPPRPLSSAPDNNNKSRNRKHSSSDDDDEDHNSLRTNEHVVAATTTTTSGATAPPLKAVNARIAATAVRMATNERKARIMEQLAAQNIDVACSTVSPPTANGVVGKRNGSSNASFPSTSTSLSPQQIIDATIVSALTQSFEDNFAAAAAAAAVENDVPSGDEQVGVAVDVVIERTRYERNSGGEVAAQSAGRGSGYGSHS